MAASRATGVERRWLWHASRADVVPKILTQGFNRSFAGYNACAYGKGVYFARDADYSTNDTYSKPDEHGVKRMFACRVAVGVPTKGERDALTPPVRDGDLLYDSTVNNVSDPTILVMYHDSQAYPEYLLKFRRRVART